MAIPFRSFINDFKQSWPDLTSYQRFERLIATVLLVLTAIVTIFATLRLAYNLFQMFVLKTDFLEYAVFQSVFGMIMTILIALEFNRSISSVLEGRAHLLQVQTVVLIGLMALVRKFIILDVKDTEPLAVIGLSIATLSLAGVYWALSRKQPGTPVSAPKEKSSG